MSLPAMSSTRTYWLYQENPKSVIDFEAVQNLNNPKMREIGRAAMKLQRALKNCGLLCNQLWHRNILDAVREMHAESLHALTLLEQIEAKATICFKYQFFNTLSSWQNRLKANIEILANLREQLCLDRPLRHNCYEIIKHIAGTLPQMLDRDLKWLWDSIVEADKVNPNVAFLQNVLQYIMVGSAVIIIGFGIILSIDNSLI